jgi:hypothetical protein
MSLLIPAQERIAALEIALNESVKLQSHYAAILNDYDGGKRRIFSGPEEWIQRLIETGTIVASLKTGSR